VCIAQAIDVYLETLAIAVRSTLELILSLPSQLACKLDDSMEADSLTDWLYENVRVDFTRLFALLAKQTA